ncbi:MAG: DUF4249 family protein [Bacteroidota bacterium]|nr:DUF4249 family protein [Bacteroidota bacterium]
MNKIKNIKLLNTVLNTILILISGCTSVDDPFDYKADTIVECILYVNESIDTLKLHRTMPVDQKYNKAEAGIGNASVKIFSVAGDTIYMLPAKGKPGSYYDPTRTTVRPATQYYLEIDYPGGKQITGATITPDTFTVLPPKYRVVTYLYDTNIVRWTISNHAAAYLILVSNIEFVRTKIERDQDLLPDNQYNNKEAPTIWTFTLGTSTPLYPWLYNYYGIHEITITAMDNNLYDYVWTMYQDKMRLNEPSFHLNNAIGFFGSGVRRDFIYEIQK